MFKLFLNTTDKFLYESIKLIFHTTEKQLQHIYSKEQLLHEFEKFERNPLGCTLGNGSQFEKKIKRKIKLIMGFCFVLVPLVLLSFFSYWTGLDILFGVLITLTVALVVSSRIETVALKYINSRKF